MFSLALFLYQEQLNHLLERIDELHKIHLQ